MEKVTLKANIRANVGKAIQTLRASGMVPCNVYGKGKKNLNLSVSLHDIEKIFRETGTTSILLLDIENEGIKNVLIHDLSFNPVTSKIEHVDFYEVSMTEKITTNVPLSFTGDSSAVIDLQGSLLTSKDEVQVECLPGNLPHSIEVDISVLSDFDTVIHISDIKSPEGVEILDDPEETVVFVEAPRSEEEMAELEEPVETPEMPESEQGSEESTESNEEATEEENKKEEKE